VLLSGCLLGLLLAALRRSSPGPRALEPFLLAMAAGVFLAVTYVGRGSMETTGAMGARFTYLARALLVPLVGFCAHHLITRRTSLVVLVGLPLLVGAIINVAGWLEWGRIAHFYTQAQKAAIASAITSPAGPMTPDWVRPFVLTPYLGAGDVPWSSLRRLTPEELGLDGVQISPDMRSAALLRLRLGLLDTMPVPESSCVRRGSPVILDLSTADRLAIAPLPAGQALDLGLVDQDGTISGELRAALNLGARTFDVEPLGPRLNIEVVGDPKEDLRLRVASPTGSLQLCR
jgi:hypothetical protein